MSTVGHQQKCRTLPHAGRALLATCLACRPQRTITGDECPLPRGLPKTLNMHMCRSWRRTRWASCGRRASCSTGCRCRARTQRWARRPPPAPMRPRSRASAAAATPSTRSPSEPLTAFRCSDCLLCFHWVLLLDRIARMHAPSTRSSCKVLCNAVFCSCLSVTERHVTPAQDTLAYVVSRVTPHHT